MKLSEKLNELADELINARGHLRTISYTTEAKRSISYVECELRKLIGGLKLGDPGRYMV